MNGDRISNLAKLPSNFSDNFYAELTRKLEIVTRQGSNGFDYENSDNGLIEFMDEIAGINSELLNQDIRYILLEIYGGDSEFGDLPIDLLIANPKVELVYMLGYVYKAYFSSKRETNATEFEMIQAAIKRDPNGFFTFISPLFTFYEGIIEKSLNNIENIIPDDLESLPNQLRSDFIFDLQTAIKENYQVILKILNHYYMGIDKRVMGQYQFTQIILDTAGKIKFMELEDKRGNVFGSFNISGIIGINNELSRRSKDKCKSFIGDE